MACAEATPPVESVACTANSEGPGTDGSPEMVPEAASERPVGSAPLTVDHV